MSLLSALERTVARWHAQREALAALIEQARQDGYDSGYDDGRSVRPAVVTRLRSPRGTADPVAGSAHKFG